MNIDIQYIKHAQINKQKWDAAIENSENGLVYALSWYLDIVSPNWEALIVGDYEIVMPLTVKKKHGIKYIIQPPFTQQLGVFHQGDVKINIDLFLDNIPTCYKYININLNYGNAKGVKYNYAKRINYELSLDRPFGSIFNDFNNNTKRNSKKAIKNNLKITDGISTKELINFKKKHAVENINNKHYEILKCLCSYMEKNGIGKGESIMYTKDSEIVTAAFLIKKFNRIIYLVSASNKNGKEKSSNFLLLNELIKTNASNKIIFDFEGGVITGISRFFKGFGAVEREYYNVVINRLPWPLKYFKK